MVITIRTCNTNDNVVTVVKLGFINEKGNYYGYSTQFDSIVYRTLIKNK